MIKEEEIERFREIAYPVLTNPAYEQLAFYTHHNRVTRLQHSLSVAFMSFRIANFFHMKHMEEIVRGALLHDFFYERCNYKDYWKDVRTGPLLLNSVCFMHPYAALDNSMRYFDLTEIEQNIIASHMFPLAITMPKYKGCAAVILSDKVCCFAELLVGFPFILKRFEKAVRNPGKVAEPESTLVYDYIQARKASSHRWLWLLRRKSYC